MLQNEYLVANIGFDTAENEPLKVLGAVAVGAALAAVCFVALAGVWMRPLCQN